MLGAGLTACSGSSPSAPSSVSLGASDNGTTVHVKVPGTVVVTLASSPATGYLWRLSSGGPGFDVLVPGVYRPPSGGRQAQGTQEFEFKLTTVGTTPLLLDYSQPRFPTLPPARQFRVTLVGS